MILDYYMKVIVYIGGTKHKSFKTQIIKATPPEINFREKFVVSLTPAQLKDSSIVFHLHMRYTNKMMLNKMLVGRTIIGPYMKRADRSLSQWERNITNPLEEVNETHALYL